MISLGCGWERGAPIVPTRLCRVPNMHAAGTRVCQRLSMPATGEPRSCCREFPHEWLRIAPPRDLDLHCRGKDCAHPGCTIDHESHRLEVPMIGTARTEPIRALLVLVLASCGAI